MRSERAESKGELGIWTSRLIRDTQKARQNNTQIMSYTRASVLFTDDGEDDDEDVTGLGDTALDADETGTPLDRTINKIGMGHYKSPIAKTSLMRAHRQLPVVSARPLRLW